MYRIRAWDPVTKSGSVADDRRSWAFGPAAALSPTFELDEHVRVQLRFDLGDPAGVVMEVEPFWAWQLVAYDPVSRTGRVADPHTGELPFDGGSTCPPDLEPGEPIHVQLVPRDGAFVVTQVSPRERHFVPEPLPPPVPTLDREAATRAREEIRRLERWREAAGEGDYVIVEHTADRIVLELLAKRRDRPARFVFEHPRWIDHPAEDQPCCRPRLAFPLERAWAGAHEPIGSSDVVVTFDLSWDHTVVKSHGFIAASKVVFEAPVGPSPSASAPAVAGPCTRLLVIPTQAVVHLPSLDRLRAHGFLPSAPGIGGTRAWLLPADTGVARPLDSWGAVPSTFEGVVRVELPSIAAADLRDPFDVEPGGPDAGAIFEFHRSHAYVDAGGTPGFGPLQGALCLCGDDPRFELPEHAPNPFGFRRRVRTRCTGCGRATSLAAAWCELEKPRGGARKVRGGLAYRQAIVVERIGTVALGRRKALRLLAEVERPDDFDERTTRTWTTVELRPSR